MNSVSIKSQVQLDVAVIVFNWASLDLVDSLQDNVKNQLS